MARIAGVELPGNKKLEFSLTSVFGIGRTTARKISKIAKVENVKVADISEKDLAKIQKLVDEYTIEGDLRRQTLQNIRRLEEIGTYRGTRHKKVLPVRGQRTRSNSRTTRGRKVRMEAMKKEDVQQQKKPTKADTK